MNQIIAINVFLSPDESIIRLLRENYKLEKSDYTSESFEYIPHITLAMLFIYEENINNLHQDLKQLIYKNILLTNNKLIKKGNLYGLSISRNEYINELQKNILKITQKYKVIGNNKCFLTKTFQYKKNIDWVNKYEENNNFNDSLHITLGQLEPKKIVTEDMDNKIIFPYLGIGHMGNFCAVRRIINKINTNNK